MTSAALRVAGQHQLCREEEDDSHQGVVSPASNSLTCNLLRPEPRCGLYMFTVVGGGYSSGWKLFTLSYCVYVCVCQTHEGSWVSPRSSCGLPASTDTSAPLAAPHAAPWSSGLRSSAACEGGGSSEGHRAHISTFTLYSLSWLELRVSSRFANAC